MVANIYETNRFRKIYFSKQGLSVFNNAGQWRFSEEKNFIIVGASKKKSPPLLAGQSYKTTKPEN